MGIQAVRDVLVAASAVTSLVPAARIEPLRRTQAFATPAITLQRISVVPTAHLRSSAGPDQNLIQLDVWGDNYATCRSIADACRTALETRPPGFLMTLETEGFEPETDAELFRITQTWSVFT